MARIEAKVIHELEDQIEAFKKNIENAGKEERNKLKGIPVDEVYQKFPRTQDGKLDEAKWSALDEDEQQELCHQLSTVCESLRVAASLDGPKDVHHIMYDDYASNSAIWTLAIISFGLLVLLLSLIVLQWNQATGTDYALKIQAAKSALTERDTARDKANEAKAALMDAQKKAASAQDEKTSQDAEKTIEALESKQIEAQERAEEAIQAIPKDGASEASVLTMVILLGALGGSLHLIGSLVKFIGNRKLKRSWVLYYLALPLTGAGLAPIVYMLLRVGIINPSGASDSGSTLANLNLMAIYAFAVLAGMFSRTASDKLGEVFSTFFRTSEARAKDPLGTEKPSGSAANAGGKQS